MAESISTNFRLHMTQCLELAATKLGQVSPNPLVACIIANGPVVLAQGVHCGPGADHAEVVALQNLFQHYERNDPVLRSLQLYVNLEPCCHYGRTPPCTKAIIESGIKNIIVGCKDLFPQVAGKGIEILREAGCSVVEGVLQTECEELNRRFLIFHKQKRPYVILKWAETADGFIARGNGSSKWISSEQSRELVHHWRGEEDAILVGTETAVIDNPLLTARAVTNDHRNPVRVILDRNARVPSSHNVFDGTAPTLIFGKQREIQVPGLKFIESGPSREVNIFSILESLADQNIQSVLVEGGARVLRSFIDSELWDEIRVFRAQNSFSSGLKAPSLSDLPVKEIRSEIIGGDILKFYRPSDR